MHHAYTRGFLLLKSSQPPLSCFNLFKFHFKCTLPMRPYALSRPAVHFRLFWQLTDSLLEASALLMAFLKALSCRSRKISEMAGLQLGDKLIQYLSCFGQNGDMPEQTACNLGQKK